MARSVRPERLAEVADAATLVFGKLGYQRTHMADVARQAGMSAGAIYTYVESKEALFQLVFTRGFGQLAGGMPVLPLPTPRPEDTIRIIGGGLRRAASTPVLRAALDVEDPDDVRSELTAIVEERYAIMERLWPLLAVIERCAVDLPQLEDLYFQRGRRSHHGDLARYLERRGDSGHLRVLPDAAVAGRLISEAITWFGWHRREDRDAALYDDDVARRTVIEFVCNALVVEPR